MRAPIGAHASQHRRHHRRPLSRHGAQVQQWEPVDASGLNRSPRVDRNRRREYVRRAPDRTPPTGPMCSEWCREPARVLRHCIKSGIVRRISSGSAAEANRCAAPTQHVRRAPTLDFAVIHVNCRTRPPRRRNQAAGTCRIFAETIKKIRVRADKQAERSPQIQPWLARQVPFPPR